MTGGRARDDSAPARYRLLLDTNVCIAAEPYGGELPENIALASRLLQLAAKQHHDVFVHPAVRDDLLQNRDPVKRSQRVAELEKFQMLGEGAIPRALTDLVGSSQHGTNNHRDLRLLAALFNSAVTHLVSDDDRLIRRARRANLPVLSLAEAVRVLEDLEPAEFLPPPKVERIESYQLDPDQEIFASLRVEYGEDVFDPWLRKVQSEPSQRPCFVVKEGESYAGIAILKYEADREFDFESPTLKLSTFKVAASYAGSRYGELLLKAIFNIAHESKQGSIYVGVFPHHEALVTLLEDFGFVETAERTSNVGELIYKKSLTPPARHELSSLDYHRTFGPPALQFSQRVWVVPIRPEWHDQLFPDWTGREDDPQLELPGLLTQEPKPWGNALRKAYLCNANTDKITDGDLLMFYRSVDERGVTAVGVVERAFRTSDPNEALAFVGGRTVYSPSDVARMCSHPRGLLVILFRQDRFVEPTWSVDRLQSEGVLNRSPQTIGALRTEGARWVREQLDE